LSRVPYWRLLGGGKQELLLVGSGIHIGFLCRQCVIALETEVFGQLGFDMAVKVKAYEKLLRASGTGHGLPLLG
jgi:hypothetical protein